MTTVGDMMDRIFAFIQSADLRTVVDVVVIAMIVWFIIRGVSRLFETIVLGGLSLYAVYEIAKYLGIEIDYPALLAQVSAALQNIIAFVNSHLPG